MSLTLLLGIGVFITIVFHFIGAYAGAKRLVWVAIILLWAAAISFVNHEVKPQAYEDIKMMKGKYTQTDKLIEDAMPTVSLYELIQIKNSYLKNKHAQETQKAP
jgi:hypothetical protein